MIDGIDSYRGYELDWAVNTIIENVQSSGAEVFNSPAEMVHEAYEFIREMFLEEGLKPPSEIDLIDLITKKIKERPDIFCD